MSAATTGSGPIVDVVCSVLNGDRFLPDFLASMQNQTHRAWRLWLRDDGSTDGTVSLFERAAANDPRVNILHLGGPRLGVAQSFGWMLDRVPADSGYVMTADADDVWLPAKIERTLNAMLEAERKHGTTTPILVHTDLTVVEADLRERHSSFWRYTDLDPEPVSVRRLVVRNVATGPTVMLNAALRLRIGSTPQQATHHDWWYALVAAAVGKIVAVHESTVLYRQHGGNDVGAQPKGRVPLTRLPAVVLAAVKRTEFFRAWLGKTGQQGLALLERYGEELSESDRRFIEEYARIPSLGPLRRRMELLRLNALPQRGALRRLGALLRA